MFRIFIYKFFKR